jgi:hypothetical protein
MLLEGFPESRDFMIDDIQKRLKLGLDVIDALDTVS